MWRTGDQVEFLYRWGEPIVAKGIELNSFFFFFFFRLAERGFSELAGTLHKGAGGRTVLERAVNMGNVLETVLHLLGTGPALSI